MTHISLRKFNFYRLPALDFSYFYYCLKNRLPLGRSTFCQANRLLISRVDDKTDDSDRIDSIRKTFLPYLSHKFGESRTDESSRIETIRQYLRRIDSIWVYWTWMVYINGKSAAPASQRSCSLFGFSSF